MKNYFKLLTSVSLKKWQLWPKHLVVLNLINPMLKKLIFQNIHNPTKNLLDFVRMHNVSEPVDMRWPSQVKGKYLTSYRNCIRTG